MYMYKAVDDFFLDTPCFLQTKTYLDFTSLCVRSVLIFNFVFF